MKKIILFLLPLVLSVACIKETLEPGLEVSGEYVMEDGTGWATQYIAFMDGKYSVYTSRTTGFTFMEKSIWDYSQGEFSVKQDWYSIRDGRLFVGNKDCGKISFADETLTLGGKKYTRVATFQAEPYSSIVLPEGVEKTTDYNAKSLSFPISVQRLIPSGSISLSNIPAWIENATLANGQFSFDIPDNNTRYARTATIRFSYPGAQTVTFTLTQQFSQASIELTPDSENCDYTGGAFSFDFSVNNPREGESVTAQSQKNWITDVVVSGNAVSYKVAENNTGSTRKGTIRLSYGSLATKDFAVTQSYTASSITLTPASQDCDYTGGSFSFDFAVNNPREGVTATAQSQNNWITDVTLEDNTISYKVAENNSGSARNGTIRLSYGTYATKDFAVSQSYTASSIILTPATQECDYTGGTFSFDFVVSNPREVGSVTAQSRSDWITDVSLDGNTISYKVAENNSGAARNGAIRLSYGNYAIKDFTVSQSYTASVITLTPASQECDYTGGSFSFNFTISNPRVGATVTAQSQNDWITDVSLEGNTVRYKTAENHSGLSRSGIIHLLYENYAANDFVINQSGMPVQSLTFNKSSLAMLSGTSEILVVTVDPADAPLQWSSNNTSVAMVDQTGCVSAVGNGNAVIAVKDKSGNILWSWHIWVCNDYYPNTTSQVYYNGAGTMMDRNLGATSATPGTVEALGLLYQWGRKDPFLNSRSISSNTQAASTLDWPYRVKSTSDTGTIYYTLTHPTTFIIDNSDWYHYSYFTDDTRWQSAKTIYDPCPPGWRVPDGGDSGIWSKAVEVEGNSSFSYMWDPTNKGMNFTGKFGEASIVWYPTSGYLSNLDGSLNGVGYRGYWWSCTPDGNDAYGLDFEVNSDSGSGHVYPSDSYGWRGRAQGRSVRCQKEE